VRVFFGAGMILLMAEILHHLEFIRPENNWTNYQPQLVNRISAINCICVPGLCNSWKISPQIRGVVPAAGRCSFVM